MRLLLRQLVVAAAAAGEVAGTPQRNHILDLNSAGVVDGFPVTARTRHLTTGSTHERILPPEKKPCVAIKETAFGLERIDKRWAG
jgi:hypothetical protein